MPTDTQGSPTDPLNHRPAGPLRRVGTMAWIVLGLVPVLWIVELTGPEWLNLALRALWVLAAVATTVFGLWVLATGRRRRADGDRR